LARFAGSFGPYTTCYNGFVRWRRAGVWSRIIDALAAAHDAAVQMIDTSIVRVHQHGACITRNQRQSMGRSRGGLTSKIHAAVDSNGLSVRLALSPGEAHDVRLAGKLLCRLKSGSMLLADRGYDADWIRELAMKKGVCLICESALVKNFFPQGTIFHRKHLYFLHSHSKKLENLQAAVSLHFAHYNNVRVHKTLRVTPAMAASVNDRLWSLEELVERTTN
jgi:transposase